MKTFKSIFLGILLMALFCLSTATLATNMIGVSVFLDNMFDKPKTSNITKQTYTREIENFGTQSQMISGSYYLQFKTTGVYIGGTGITGFWTYDE